MCHGSFVSSEFVEDFLRRVVFGHSDGVVVSAEEFFFVRWDWQIGWYAEEDDVADWAAVGCGLDCLADHCGLLVEFLVFHFWSFLNMIEFCF